MTITFVSNYINHHQIPFCEACRERLGDDFAFIQTEPMEEDRVAMGWAVDVRALPYVSLFYEQEEEARRKIRESDLVLFGWTGCDELAQERLLAGKPLVRVSERLYREGQWKAISPKGLYHKYQEHIRFRNAPAYLLCAGAYVASDFALLHSYPGKKYRFGYFPRTRRYEEQALWEGKEQESTQITWAGRFLPLKHPEFALRMAKDLKERGRRFHLNMIGSGEMEEKLHAYARQNGLQDCVTFYGFLEPEAVRVYMERSQIYLFTSNHLEGWGAVVNEAMNSGCAVLAGSEAGAVPYLIRHRENGMIYNGEDEADFLEKTRFLMDHPEERMRMGREAYRTITELWNAQTAAERFLEFAGCVVRGETYDAPKEGPMSLAPVVRPFVRV
ncbi:MAG: glycosyltransferase [Eubacteriales bacterium]|nr:glycosyltransferase [Eubacteriales bacterium]